MTASELARLIESYLAGAYAWTSGAKQDQHISARSVGPTVFAAVHGPDGAVVDNFTILVLNGDVVPRAEAA